jgi:glycosyltransferase involved in cell wall biosynthesis
MNSSEVCFVGLGLSQIAWYRSALPALQLGCDWVGVRGEDPDDLTVHSALSRQGIQQPDLFQYKIVILEEVYGQKWAERIGQLQRSGVIVLYEVDDYLHAVRKVKDHDGAKRFTMELVAQHEVCMRLCDGIIVSTQWLGEKYRRFNDNIYVIENAIDIVRYEKFSRRLKSNDSQKLVVGWSGGTGHKNVWTKSWMARIQNLMFTYKDIHFFNMGENFAQDFHDRLQDRIGYVKSSSPENYPGALSHMDVALAPCGHTDFFRAKSDLRWLEASAIRIPTIADPFVYRNIIDGVTGLLAQDSTQMARNVLALLNEPERALEVAENAHAWVAERRSFPDACVHWEQALLHAELTLRPKAKR